MPQKSIGNLNMDVAILNFGCKTTVRLNTSIEKIIEKFSEFYKAIHLVHNQCMILAGALDQDFPVKEEHLKNFAREAAKGIRKYIKYRIC